MFNKKFIGVLIKILAILILIAAAVFFISGFFVVTTEPGTALEKAAFLLGYEIGGLAIISFVYIILAALHGMDRAILEYPTRAGLVSFLDKRFYSHL